MRKIKSNEKILKSLICYYYLEKGYTIKEIAQKLTMCKRRILRILKQKNIEIIADVNLKGRTRLGFHLYYRLKLSLDEASKLSNISKGTLKKYCLKKQVKIRPSIYSKMSKTQQEVFNKMWKNERDYIQKNNFEVPKEYSEIISPRMGDRIIELFNEDTSPQKMSDLNLIPIGSNTIRKFLQLNGIVLKKNGYYTKIYSANEDYFQNINTEEKAYWLGFIMGDGCVQGDDERENWTLQLSLSEKDKDHLVLFNKSIENTSPICDYLVNNRYKTSSVTISSTSLARSLFQYGIVKNKTYTSSFPSIIKDEFKSHFLRGLFDADGSIPKSNGVVMGISICGTPELMFDISKMVKIDEKYIYKRKDLVNFAEIRCHKVQEAVRILDYIYKDSNIFLKRKHDRYLQLKERLNKIKENKNGKGVETIKSTLI